MNTSIYLASALVLASLAAMAPGVSANHDCLPEAYAYPCVIATSNSYGDGDCDGPGYGSAYNTVSVQTGNTAAGRTSVYATTSCYESGSSYSDSIRLSASSYGGPAGYQYASAYWYAYDYGWFAGCGSGVYAYGAGTTNLGLCDAAGGPPGVPALLP